MSKKESKSLGNGIESFDPNPRHYRLEDRNDHAVEGVKKRVPSALSRETSSQAVCDARFPQAQTGCGGSSLPTALLKQLCEKIETRNLAKQKVDRRYSLSQRQLRRWLERQPQS